MRGLACHPCPHFLAIGAPARANRVHTSEKKQRERARLHERNEAKPEHERRVADVNRTDAFFYDGLVLSIQRRDVTPERLIALTPRIGVPATSSQLVER